MKIALITALLFFRAALSYPANIPLDVIRPPADTIPSAKPILTSLVTAFPPTLRIINDSSLPDYANIVLDWEIRANGQIRQKGSLYNPPLLPRHPAIIHLPLRMPPAPGEELFLGVHYHYRDKPSPGKPGHPIPGRSLAKEQFLLRPWTNSQLAIHTAGELSFTDESGFFTIRSQTALLRFDKQTGWLQQYETNGSSWLADTPGLKSHLWLDTAEAANRDPHLQLFSTSTGSQLVIVRTEYTLPEINSLLHLSYTINATGEMTVEQSMEQNNTDSTHHGEPLPCFGMYFLLVPGFDSITVYGGAPEPALFHFPVTPSRENITYPNTRYWMITRQNGQGIRFTADSALLTINTRSAQPRLLLDAPAGPYQLPDGSHHYAFKISPAPPEEKSKNYK